jgi:iron(III) transport system substrate-binding protein
MPKADTQTTNKLALKLCTVLLVLLAFLLGSLIPRAGSAEPPGLIEGARKEGSLMIYSLLAVPDHSRIVNRFKEKYPFIEVSLIRPGASERITARVMTEARAGQHLVDVIGVSRVNMLHLISRGLIMNYDSPER